MYQVILRHDKGREYYHNYIVDDGIKGTIECEELPPYQDIIKARACYYDAGDWIFNSEKYAELSETDATTATNEELSEAVLELANTVDELITSLDALASNVDVISLLEQLAQKIVGMKKGEDDNGENLL